MNDIGQDISQWTNHWKTLTPESEIKMWDYFGLRPWILKYTPRFGKVVEAGCGLGRFVFYLGSLGIDIDGIDFSKDTIDLINGWQKKYNFNFNFINADIKKMPYKDSLLSGYLSFGVIEHFIEGPDEVIKECYRVLRPGGIAIVTTPSKSWIYYYRGIKKILKRLLSFLNLYEYKKEPFFQYHYKPSELMSFFKKNNFHISRYEGSDLTYTLTELGGYSNKYIKSENILFKIFKKSENSYFRRFGAQSIVIAIKLDKQMYCFLCGHLNVSIHEIDKYEVPICKNCRSKKEAKYYIKGTNVGFKNDLIIAPKVLKPENRVCKYCKQSYLTNELFEEYGFNENVCEMCIKKPLLNIQLSNEQLKPIWRNRV